LVDERREEVTLGKKGYLDTFDAGTRELFNPDICTTHLTLYLSPLSPIFLRVILSFQAR